MGNQRLNIDAKTVNGTKLRLLAILSVYDTIYTDVDFLVDVLPKDYRCTVKSIDIIKPEINDKDLAKYLENVRFYEEPETT